MAFDYETTGLKPDRPEQQIVSCSFCLDGYETWACRIDKKSHAALSKVLLSLLPKIAANMKFEERWTRAKLGHGVANWDWDTMVAAHVLDNRPGITSLKFQAYVQFGIGEYDSTVAPYLRSDSSNGLNRIREVPIQDLLLYNGLDSLIEFKLAEKQKGLMQV